MRALLLACLLLASPALAQPPEPLARFPNGTFLENLIREPSGRVLFTSYFARRIEAWSPAGAGVFAEVPIHPVSLAAIAGGYALAGHGAPFTAGPAALAGSNAVLLLDPSGALVRRIPLPGAVFLNGMLELAPGLLLVVDSALGRIWAVDVASGATSPWFEHPALAPDAARPMLPGVNGIKRDNDGSLLVSNSGQRVLLRLRLAEGRPAGEPTVLASFPGIDDFAVAPDGTILAATHATGIARLRPGAAAPELLAAPGLEGSTALLLEGGAALVLATGGLLEGGRGEAWLARLPLP